MATITKTLKFKRLDFDTTYTIRGRVRWRDLIGEYGEEYYYKTLGEDDIPAPTGVVMDFDRKDAGKHFRWKAIVDWENTLLPNCKTVDDYVVEIWKWDRKTNSIADTEWEKRKEVFINKAKFFPIAKKFWWVARVAAIVKGVQGPWSEWSDPGSPRDTQAPPTPLQVKILRGVNRIITEWNEPSEFAVLNGTVSASSGTTAVTGANTSFVTEVGEGVYIRLGQEIKTVIDVVSDTSLTVDTTWVNTYTNTYFEVDVTEDNVAYGRIQMAQDKNFNNIIRQDMRVSGQQIGLRAEDDVLHYTRVSLVDSSGVVSKWVPATHSGNDNPNAEAEGRKPKNLDNIPPFSVSGVLQIKHYKHRYYVDDDYRVKSVRISVGEAPAGGPIKIQVYKNKDNDKIFTDPNRPTITAGNNTGRSNDVREATRDLEDGDFLTIAVEEIGNSTHPGEDLTVQVRLVRVN